MTSTSSTSTSSTERVAPTLGGLWHLAWPVIVSRSTSAVVNLADSLMVADLGSVALASTTAGAMNTFVLLILPMGTLFIVQSFAAQLFGKGDLEGARRFGWYGLIVAFVTQLLALASLPLVEPGLGLMPHEEDVVRTMAEYMRIRLLGAGAFIGLEALANYYGGIGNTRRPMIASVAAMVLNIIGNFLLIEGHLGFPAMGVRGAAWASVLSGVIAFLGLFVGFAVKGRPRGLSMRELVRMLRFGLPAGFNWFFEFFAFIWFIDIVLGGLGTTALAAFMAVLQVNSVSFMPAFGLASAGAILVGQAIGANVRDDVPKAVRLTLMCAGSWQGFIALVYLVLPDPIFRPLAGDPVDTALLLLGIQMLMLSSAWQLFDAVVNTLSEALRGAGDTAFPLVARIALAWGLFVPGSWISVQYFDAGPLGATVWVVGYLAILAGVLWVRYARGAWRRIVLVEGSVPGL